MWDTEREIASLVPRIAVPDNKDAWLMHEDIPDFIWAQMPHFRDLDDCVMTLRRYHVFLLDQGSHGVFLIAVNSGTEDLAAQFICWRPSEAFRRTSFLDRTLSETVPLSRANESGPQLARLHDGKTIHGIRCLC